MSETSAQKKDYLWGLIASIAAISVAAIGFGHSLPLFATLLKTYGASDGTIGLNTGTSALAAIVLTPFFPRIIEWIGLKPFLLACLVLMILTYGLLGLAGDRIELWFPLRFFFGAAGAGLFVGSEIWINALAPDRIRGRVIGIYATSLALGFAIGPMLIWLFGTAGFLPFFIGMLIFSAAILPVAFAKTPQLTEAEESTKDFFALIPKAPATFLSASLFAGAEAAILTFLPVYALEIGWGEEIGAWTVTVYGLGLVAFQYLIGRQADKIGYGRSLLALAILSVIGAIFFALIGDVLAPLFVVLFLWGGVIAGLYTVGLTLIGDRFPKKDMAAANTGFVFMYGVGAILGPVGAGWARQVGGQTGLELFLTGMLVLYAVLVFLRRRQQLP